jgi:anti-anti-sigma factor
MDDEVRVETRKVDDVAVIDVAGDVTTAAETKIIAAYETLAGGGTLKFVLNFTNVEYINSSGIAIVIGLLTRTRKQGQRLSIYGLNRHFQKMFQIVGVDRYTTLCQSEAEALASL